MNTRELDRLLCERLGIEGRRRGCLCDGQECRSPAFCSATIYPRLSTTGDGMLRLMEALRARGYGYEVAGSSVHHTKTRGSIWVNAAESIKDVFEDSAPLALALAAARALGIEVPE